MSLQKVFISYSSKNREIALRLRDTVQAWGYPTWIDVVEITAGEVWPQEIQDGLDSSDVILGIVTSDSIKSLEVLAEWNEGYGKKNLILVRYEDVSLNYRWKILHYADCSKDETAGLQQLKTSLEQFGGFCILRGFGRLRLKSKYNSV